MEVIEPAVEPVKLARLMPLRRGVGCGHAPPREEDLPVLAVPGRDSVPGPPRVLVCGPSLPSSEAMSVIRDEMILGGPAGNFGLGKLSCRSELSLCAIAVTVGKQPRTAECCVGTAL